MDILPRKEVPMKRSLWLFAVLLVIAPAVRLDGQEKLYRPNLQAKDIEPTLRTDWYGMYNDGKKIGYFKASREKKDDTIVESIFTSMKLVSMGKKSELKITQSVTFANKAPYKMLLGTFHQDDGMIQVKITARRTEKGFSHTVEAAGQKQTRAVADLDYTLADAMGSEVWMHSLPKVDATILCKDLDVQEWKADETVYTLKALKTSLVGGVEVKFLEAESESKVQMIKSLGRYDSAGRLLQGKFAIFELRLEPEDQAKNTEYSQDLFVLGQAKIDRPIGYTKNLTELVLEIDGKAGEVFEDGPRQTVVVKGDKRLIKLGKAFGREVKATDKEIEESLKETTAYAITNPKVKALAKKAVGDAETPEDKLRRIVAFVKRFIEPELNASLPNIHDLLELKKGDCKCYALLTTNLCRAAGIPARDVSGLLYMGDDTKAFGGHAWNEVVLNGVWVPVDASLNEVDLDAGHICFGTEQRATKNLINSLGKLSFRMISSRSK